MGGAKMSARKAEQIKQQYEETIEGKKAAVARRHAEAEARAENIKQAVAEKGAKMSARKAEQIKQQYEETIEEKKAADAKRHAEAEARAEKGAKMGDVAPVQTKRTLLFEMEGEKAMANEKRHAEAIARKDALLQEKTAKASRMAGSSPKKSAPVTSTTSTASLSPSKEAWAENNDD